MAKVKHYRGCRRSRGSIIALQTVEGRRKLHCTDCGDYVFLDNYPVDPTCGIRGSNPNYKPESIPDIRVTLIGRPLPRGMSAGIVGFIVRKKEAKE